MLPMERVFFNLGCWHMVCTTLFVLLFVSLFVS